MVVVEDRPLVGFVCGGGRELWLVYMDGRDGHESVSPLLKECCTFTFTSTSTSTTKDEERYVLLYHMNCSTNLE